MVVCYQYKDLKGGDYFFKKPEENVWVSVNDIPIVELIAVWKIKNKTV